MPDEHHSRGQQWEAGRSLVLRCSERTMLYRLLRRARLQLFFPFSPQSVKIGSQLINFGFKVGSFKSLVPNDFANDSLDIYVEAFQAHRFCFRYCILYDLDLLVAAYMTEFWAHVWRGESHQYTSCFTTLWGLCFPNCMRRVPELHVQSSRAA
jgi:hypothetical protein